MLTFLICLSLDLVSSAHDSWRTRDSFSDSPGNFFISDSPRETHERIITQDSLPEVDLPFDVINTATSNFHKSDSEDELMFADEETQQRDDIPQTEAVIFL